MVQLQLADLVKKSKGDKRKGYGYEVVNYDDYKNTNTQIETLLNTKL